MGVLPLMDDTAKTSFAEVFMKITAVAEQSHQKKNHRPATEIQDVTFTCSERHHPKNHMLKYEWNADKDTNEQQLEELGQW